MSFDLPAVDVVVQPPSLPSITMAPPSSATVVVPVGGPPGPQGPQGEAGDPADSLGYVYITSNPATVHQIQHGLVFKPAGITCTDADGSPLLGFSVAYPSTGVTEVSFGSAVTPTIYLS